MGGSRYNLNLKNKILFQPPDYSEDNNKYEKLKSGGDEIPILVEIIPDTKHIIIYSHANATDLHENARFLEYTSTNLKVSVVGYSYSGYMGSLVLPSEKKCVQNLSDVYKYVIELGFESENIIIFGTSIGAGISAGFVAHTPNFLGKLILETPMTCISDILSDVYNVPRVIGKMVDGLMIKDHIKKITSPILIIAAENDEVTPYTQSEKLYKLHKNMCIKRGVECEDIFKVDGATHNDIMIVCGDRVYFERIKQFIQK